MKEKTKPTRHKRIDAHFRPEDEELYQFVKSQVNGWGDTSQAIRRFIEIAQLFGGNITEAQLARQALDEKRTGLAAVDSVDQHSDEIGEVE